MSQIQRNPAIVNAFHIRFNKEPLFNPKIASRFDQICIHNFIDHPVIQSMKPGDVIAAMYNYQYKLMVFSTKHGVILVFENNFGGIGYRCDHQFYTDPYWRGMFATAGQIRSVEMMDRIFSDPHL